MRISHKQKVKLARQHRTQEELIQKTPLFQTKWWENRKRKRASHVANRRTK